MNGTTQDADGETTEQQVVETDWERDVEPSTVLVTAVADARGVDATDLRPLYETIDSAALDTLFIKAAGDETLSVSFDYEGFAVTLWGDGRIELVDESA